MNTEIKLDLTIGNLTLIVIMIVLIIIVVDEVMFMPWFPFVGQVPGEHMTSIFRCFYFKLLLLY